MLQKIPDPHKKYLKDLVPDLQRQDVVYRTPCAMCNSPYIGQTGRKLSQRLQMSIGMLTGKKAEFDLPLPNMTGHVTMLL